MTNDETGVAGFSPSDIDRIQRQPSELPELWEGNADWTAAMTDLRNRLTN